MIVIKEIAQSVNYVLTNQRNNLRCDLMSACGDRYKLKLLDIQFDLTLNYMIEKHKIKILLMRKPAG